MPTTSRPLYLYLQRPDNGVWVTVGRYRAGAPGEGTFRYAPSYVEAGLAWPIDPVNLRFLPDLEVAAPRYRGLHDVLRDTCPDAWGQSLLRREHNLPANAPPLQYLQKAGNLDRWGAIAVGASVRIPQAGLGSPSPPRHSRENPFPADTDCQRWRCAAEGHGTGRQHAVVAGQARDCF